MKHCLPGRSLLPEIPDVAGQGDDLGIAQRFVAGHVGAGNAVLDDAGYKFAKPEESEDLSTVSDSEE